MTVATGLIDKKSDGATDAVSSSFGRRCKQLWRSCLVSFIIKYQHNGAERLSNVYH